MFFLCMVFEVITAAEDLVAHRTSVFHSHVHTLNVPLAMAFVAKGLVTHWTAVALTLHQNRTKLKHK